MSVSSEPVDELHPTQQLIASAERIKALRSQLKAELKRRNWQMAGLIDDGYPQHSVANWGDVGRSTLNRILADPENNELGLFPEGENT